jgi:DNA mismatch repair protein MutL
MDLWKSAPELEKLAPEVLAPPVATPAPVPAHAHPPKAPQERGVPENRVAEAPAPFGNAPTAVIDTLVREPRLPAATPVRTETPPRAPAPEFRILGQAAASYIVIEDEEGVKLIDQHALHERVLFEALLEKSKQSRSQGSQKLLVPEQIELSPQQAAAISDVKIRETLLELGFDLEDFGPRTVLLRSQPLALRGHRAATLVVQLIESLGKGSDAAVEGLPKATFATLREKAIYIISCKSAIKAGEVLNVQQMEALLSEFFRLTGNTPLPPGAKSVSRFTCPHGRPLAVEMNWDEIERRVGR